MELAAVDDQWRISQVTEKQPISTFASTGTYYFRSAAELLELVRHSIHSENTVNGEYYVGPLYN